MRYTIELLGQAYIFESVKEVLAKASEEKSGDTLAGIGANSQEERIAARSVLADLSVELLTNEPVVSYERDEVTRLIQDDLNQEAYEFIKNQSLGQLRDYLLQRKVTSTEMLFLGKGMTGEVIAGLAKLMTNMDLVYLANRIEVTASCVTTIGRKGVLASRLQPNHPSDDLDGILASLLEGLSYGIGDAVIGLNPVDDTPDHLKSIMDLFESIKIKYEIPTQTCVLGHIRTQLEAMKRGGKADLLFQSIAGSEKGNREFGVSINLLEEGYTYMLDRNTNPGDALMYFETGQGSELSSNSHYDSDQTTMEARCYCLARHFNPFLVNSVVGFIGPEYLYDSKQVIRAGLEDHFMAKLAGIPMGVDVCYTNHMKADENDMDNLGLLLANAGCNFFIGIPGGDDVMLYYQSLSYHDIATLREITGKTPMTEFQKWMTHWGLDKEENRGNPTVFLDHKEDFQRLQERTVAKNQIGSAGTRYKTETLLELQAQHAAAVDSVTRNVSKKWLELSGLKTFKTSCENREIYLLRPDYGRFISSEVLDEMKATCVNKPQVQIYISDGLSVSAIEANALETYAALRQGLEKVKKIQVGDCFYLENGRVGAMDYIGKGLGAEVTCVLIGERPGLATAKSMSAYITYHAYPGIQESARTVVSNIHEEGANPIEAGAYIADLIEKILAQKTSGVDLVI